MNIINLIREFLTLGVIVGVLPNTITNGNTIDAVPVMANYNWIISQVNSNAAPTASPTFTGTITASAMNMSGNLDIASGKFTVASATGNTVVGGTLSSTGNFDVATSKFTVNASTGAAVFAGAVSGITTLTTTTAGSSLVQETAIAMPTLQNSWVDYGAPFCVSSYFKDSQGIVHLQGLIKSGTTAGNTLISTLPAGYRPSSSVLLTGSSNGTTFSWYVTVASDGTIKIGAGADAGYVSFEGMSFRAA